jgi:hypothetical protein
MLFEESAFHGGVVVNGELLFESLMLDASCCGDAISDASWVFSGLLAGHFSLGTRLCRAFVKVRFRFQEIGMFFAVREV